MYEALFAAEVTIGTLVFVFIPLVAQLAHDNKIFLTRNKITLIKIDSVVLLIGIFVLFSAVYLENAPPQFVEPLKSALPDWILPVSAVLVFLVFCLGVFITFYVGYDLLRQIIPT